MDAYVVIIEQDRPFYSQFPEKIFNTKTNAMLYAEYLAQVLKKGNKHTKIVVEKFEVFDNVDKAAKLQQEEEVLNEI